MHLVSTDLPAPLSPQSAVTSPAGRSRSTLLSASTGPKCFSRPRALRSGSALAGLVITGVDDAGRSPMFALHYGSGSEGGKGNGAASHRQGDAIRNRSVFGYLMLAAEQTLAPTAVQSAVTSTNLSAMTVDSMLEESTQIGTSSE